ncbi:hypothetical protein EUGRSUZ_H04550 [Eucalyptus grandis]|uniref:Bidirectional sugar transporter SWEET n=2 Tax=Eucalyptus grandis TaxID=71139 RepID=A0A059B890_EUCGR|nr:hypothetical protein EUGRSUZ_H04550 [Eucalyptus grandis]
MASLSFMVGIFGNIISILVFTSPIKTFWQVVKKRCTENYKGVPYITTLLSTSLWSFYGILKPGGLLVLTVNAAGAIMQFIYVTLFLIYAPKDKRIQLMKLVALLDVGFPGVVVAVTLLAIHGNMRLTVVGILCAALTIGMYASPLAVMVPNGIGFILGSAQLILYAIYKNQSAASKLEESTEEAEEDGSAHLVKGDVEIGSYNVEDENQLKNRTIARGRSLPKPPVSRQYSLQKIMKTLSMSP